MHAAGAELIQARADDGRGPGRIAQDQSPVRLRLALGASVYAVNCYFAAKQKLAIFGMSQTTRNIHKAERRDARRAALSIHAAQSPDRERSSLVNTRCAVISWMLTACLLLVMQPAGAGTITGSAHDFSIAAWAGGQVCVACHTPHNAKGTATAAPLWNHTITTQVYTCLLYTSPSPRD